MAWSDTLLPASWRGVPFGVLSAEISPGRATAEHFYPYRETTPVWAEDVGAKRHPFIFQGFLVDGDQFAAGLSIFVQRDSMVAACNQKGAGTLIHPSLGVRTVVLVGEGCRMVERVDMGGAIELTFTFVESAKGPMYPASTTSTTTASQAAASATNGASSTSATNSLGGALQSGGASIGQAVDTVSGFVGQAETLVSTATRYVGAVKGIVGFVGRFANGKLSTTNPAATVSSALAVATAARTAVSTAGSTATGLASLL